MSKFFDLSHPFVDGMPCYPGDTPPSIQRQPDAPAPWQLHTLQLGTHSGTHLDAPAHYFPQGKTLDQFPLERFVLPGRVIALPELPDQARLGWELIAAQVRATPPGHALVLRTGWSRFWGTERYWQYPALTAEAAQELAAGGAQLLGIDAPSFDPLVHQPPLIHEILLGREIILVENLNRLEQLTPGQTYQFSFLPLLLAGLDGAPLRAVAWES